MVGVSDHRIARLTRVSSSAAPSGYHHGGDCLARPHGVWRRCVEERCYGVDSGCHVPRVRLQSGMHTRRRSRHAHEYVRARRSDAEGSRVSCSGHDDRGSSRVAAARATADRRPVRRRASGGSRMRRIGEAIAGDQRRGRGVREKPSERSARTRIKLSHYRDADNASDGGRRRASPVVGVPNCRTVGLSLRLPLWIRGGGAHRISHSQRRSLRSRSHRWRSPHRVTSRSESGSLPSHSRPWSPRQRRPCSIDSGDTPERAQRPRRSHGRSSW